MPVDGLDDGAMGRSTEASMTAGCDGAAANARPGSALRWRSDRARTRRLPSPLPSCRLAPGNRRQASPGVARAKRAVSRHRC